MTLYAVQSYTRVVIVGLGGDVPAARDLQQFGGAVVKASGSEDSESVSILWSGQETNTLFPTAHIALGLQLGSYKFDKYKTPGEDDAAPARRFVIHTESPRKSAQHWRENWAGLAEGVYFARDLINEQGPKRVESLCPTTFIEANL